MAERRDYLAECNSEGVAIPDFEAAFCARCLQPECQRSRFGQSRFEKRTSNWKTRLFEAVPRMDDSDPRIIQLRTKRFIEVPTGRIPEVGSGWRDPRDLVDEPLPIATPPVSSVPPRAVAEEPEEAPVSEPPPAMAPPIPAPSPISPPAVSEAPLATRPLNTPRQQGQMLGGRAPVAPKTQDAWAVTPTETKGLPVVRPGTRIKMGSGV